MNKRYDTKIPSIISRKVVNEEIIFKGKKIIRERIIKEFNIPKIIKHDIGFQLMFGMTASQIKPASKNGGIRTHSYDDRSGQIYWSK